MILSTDSTANLPKDLYKKLNISMTPMQIVLENEIYDDLSEKLPVKEYYQKMKDGATPTTAQINEQTAREYFEDLLKKGEDVLHISFSSALSGTTSAIIRVAEELNTTHKNKIVVVDSLNASMGEGILVLAAHDMMQQGKSIDEIATELETLKHKACAYFTVEQLKYLVRGGRVSKLSGMVGSILNIKPVLRVDEEGRLVSYKKVISRKKSIAELQNIITDKIGDKKHVYICHADCEQDANDLANSVETLIGAKPVVTDLTQVIGCHTGPGLLALFFFGKDGK
ncbi:MAG: DegV family protein [Clostridia bacterium]|nr:DegV family protein [Clostridia bacterium]